MATGDGTGGGPLTGLSENDLATLDKSLQKAIELEEKMRNIALNTADYNRALQAGYEIQEKTLQKLGDIITKNGINEDVLNQINTLQFTNSQTLEKINALAEQAANGTLKQAEYHAQVVALLDKEKATFELIKKTSRETEQFVGGIAGKLGIATKFSDTSIGKFDAMAKKLQESGAGAEILTTALETTFSPLNLAASLLEKMYESVLAVTFALDAANSQFQRATGFAGDFKDQMMGIASAGVASGVSIEDAGKAMSSLTNNFSAFNPNAEATNQALGTTIALLEKTGVSGDQAAKTMDFFNKVVGASPTAAAGMTKQLALAGRTIGITTSKMLADFESVNGYLIGFGDRSTEVFLELQAQAKATGIAIGTLVGIAKKFDTFDEAAKTVGSLNAALGTQLSTIDMINMSTEQRIAALAQEIDLAAGGFENLDRYTQMYVAQAIGAKDAAEAQRLINLQRNPAELAKYNAKMQEQQARQEDLNKITEEFVPFLEQLKIAVFGLGLALAPVVQVLGTFIGWLGTGIGWLTKWMVAVPGVTTVLAAMLAVWVGYKVLGPITGLFDKISLGFKKLAIDNTTLAASQTAQATAQANQAAVQSTTAPVIQASSGAISAGMLKMAVGLAIASLALIAVAFAIKLAVPPLIEMFNVLVSNVDVLPELMLYLLGLGPAFIMFGAGVLIGAIALAAATPFLWFANTQMSLMAETVQVLGAGFMAMGTGITLAATSLGALITGLSAIQELTNEDHFFAITTDGGKTSMVSAKGGIIKNFTSESITVDVKIPEIKMPEVNVKVYIGDRELRDIIRKEVDKL